MIVGKFATPDGASMRLDQHGSATCYTTPAFEYRRRQPAHIPLDLLHDEREIGEIVYVERSSRSGLIAVAVSDADPDALADLDERAYLSSSIIGTPRGAAIVDIELRAVSIVNRGAVAGLGSIRVIPGDLNPGGWHNHTPNVQILRRAAAYHRRRRPGEGLEIAELDTHEHRTGVTERMGPIEYHPGGRIIAVR